MVSKMKLWRRFLDSQTEPKTTPTQKKLLKIDLYLEHGVFIDLGALGVSKMEASNPLRLFVFLHQNENLLF